MGTAYTIPALSATYNQTVRIMSATNDQPNLVSPNELLERAKEVMLEGKEIKTTHDAYLVLNFMAYNIAEEARDAALELIWLMYEELQLVPRDEVPNIASYQTMLRRKEDG